MISVFYIVGGNDVHYNNFSRSVKSLKDKRFNGKIIVLEIGTKLSSNGEYSVINEPDKFDLNKGKTGFLFWKQKYIASLKIDTDYGIYLDSDTVLVNNNFDELLPKIGEKIGVCQHFWVPNFSKFYVDGVPDQNKPIFNLIKQKLNIQNSQEFFAGGIFLFKNSENNRKIFQETLKVYDEIYDANSSYIKGLTDEVFFSNILHKYNNFYILNGAINHCCMGNDLMPLKMENNILYGKNSFENDWEKITILHCDTSRRNPGINYSQEINNYIRKQFYLCELP